MSQLENQQQEGQQEEVIHKQREEEESVVKPRRMIWDCLAFDASGRVKPYVWTRISLSSLSA